MILMENILARVLYAFMLSMVYTFFSMIIYYGLHILRKEEEKCNFDFSYLFVTNTILIIIILFFTIKENIELF